MYTDNKLEPMEETNKPLEHNLYNRLDKDVAIKLDAIATRFPTIHKLIKDDLQANEFAMDLKFDTVNNMHIYLNTDSNYFHILFKSVTI